jgi:heterodisulfide reductase subunit C
MSHTTSLPAGTVAALVADATGVAPTRCYQCGRCAAGCMQNVAGEMDLAPTRLMRLLQLEAAFAHDAALSAEYAARALGADAPWLCAGCLACSARCPQGVDVAGAMDVLRHEALKRGLASRSARARDAQALHRTFLAEALRRGRVHELSLVAGYKLRTGHLLADAALAPGMLRRGKLKLSRPHAPPMERARAALEALRRRRAAAAADAPAEEPE